MKNNYKCPACGNHMILRHKRGVWVCVECPMVIFEFYGKNSVDTLENALFPKINKSLSMQELQKSIKENDREGFDGYILTKAGKSCKHISWDKNNHIYVYNETDETEEIYYNDTNDELSIDHPNFSKSKIAEIINQGKFYKSGVEEKNNVLIEVSGGTIQNIFSDIELNIQVADFDGNIDLSYAEIKEKVDLITEIKKNLSDNKFQLI